MLRRSHDHHRGLRARCNATASADSSTDRNQDRHLMTASQSRKSARRARWLSTGHGSSALRYPAVVANRRANLAAFNAIRRCIRQRASPSANSLDRLNSNHSHHPRRSNPHSACRATLVPLPRFPCMGLFLSRSSPERQIFCPSSVSLFDLKARFFVPTRGSLTSSRAGAVKVGRRANLAAYSELARPYLDSSEHDGTLGAIGMTIRGEPAFGRGSVAPQPCIRWVQGPEP